MKKILAVLIALTMMFAVIAACGGDTSAPAPAPAPAAETPAPAADTGTFRVGISMPTQSLQRWNQDGANMEAMFLAEGFEVDLQFGGENEVPVQIAQIENMIASGANVLVVAAIDGFSLTEVLATAQAQGIPVISYDRLIMDTPAVSYYATFDNWMVGEYQGQFLVDVLDLAGGAGPFNMELFTGDPGDNNIHFFFGGAMSKLQPFIDGGQVVIPSGQTDIMQVATVDWNPANAQARMENLISMNNYSPTGGTTLHAVMCNNDSTAQGVITALQGAGFTADNFPYITGQDCDIVSVKHMINGYQSMSVFKDTRMLAASVVDMVKAIMAGTPVPVNDRESYDNGTGIIPTWLCPPVVGTPDNIRELLIDSGYYTEAEIFG